MAASILHIKDSYYFEVPKFLWRYDYSKPADFPDVWVKLDADYQQYEAAYIYKAIGKVTSAEMPPLEDLKHDFEHWQHHDHHNDGKPFDVFLVEHGPSAFREKFDVAKSSPADVKNVTLVWQDQVRQAKSQAIKAYKTDPEVKWSAEKVAGYNRALSGKVLIPQPFGELRNLYQPESGFCISRFMLIEVAVALIICVLFSWLAQKLTAGGPPRGKLWNLLESFVLFIRDQVARPNIGGHGHDEHGHDEHGHGHDEHGKHEAPSKHAEPTHAAHHEADRFVPILLTVFFFILGCNLMGMLPWVGSPTASWSVTGAMALVTFATVWISGIARFGVLGFFLNQIPGMDLPLALAVVIKPAIFLIELLGLCIKHGVLSVRLLANMMAGHMVLLAILALAFSPEGASSSIWPVIAFASLVGSMLLSCLELFVAFLQAFVFTLLSAIFIGAAIHKH